MPTAPQHSSSEASKVEAVLAMWPSGDFLLSPRRLACHRVRRGPVEVDQSAPFPRPISLVRDTNIADLMA